MDKVLARIASFISLKLTNIIIVIFLGAIQVYFAFNGYINFSPLYVLFFVLISPFCISSFLGRSDENRKKLEELEKDWPFPELRKKHHYTSLTFKGQSYTFVITVILCGIWNYRTTAPSLPGFDFALVAPMLVLIVYVAVRLFTWIVFLAIFRFFPTLGWKI